MQEACSLGEERFPLVKVHPRVVFSVLNQYMRREDRSSRVLGTLLGRMSDDVIEVGDAFVGGVYVLIFVDHGVFWRSSYGEN